MNWPEITTGLGAIVALKSLAKRVSVPGCRIRVREASGQTIILIGAGAALYYPKFEPDLVE